MIWRSKDTERTQRSGGMVINRLGAASLRAAKDVAVIPNMTERKNTIFIVEGKTQMFAVHAYQENRCHMCMQQLCEFANHILNIIVDY